MKAKKNKKRKHKRKTFITKCMNCGKDEITGRPDAKYGSELCKKRESLYRKEKGYVHEIKKGLKNGIKEFYNEGPSLTNNNPFTMEIKEFIRTQKAEENLLSWKHEFDGFILYFFPNLKKNYDIFYNENRKKSWEHYVKMNPSLFEKKIELKNYDSSTKLPYR